MQLCADDAAPAELARARASFGPAAIRARPLAVIQRWLDEPGLSQPGTGQLQT
jgi:hypothetical protein